MNSNDADRRTVLKATGVTLAGVTLAGCSSSDDGNGDNDDSDNGDDAIEIEPETEILFEATTQDWTGNAPSEIEGESNPTLALAEGETYTIGWNEGDGTNHNMELRDSDDNVVEDYGTDLTGEPGDDQLIEFEATSEIEVYRCMPHASMEGDIVMQ